MSNEWVKRAPKDAIKDYNFVDEKYLGTIDNAPSTVYEKRPLVNPETGEKVEGLYTGWVILNNPRAGNAYNLDMLKGAATALCMAAQDKSVVAIILTGAGDSFFCTGGNVKEYSEYYAGRPQDTQRYLALYWQILEFMYTSPKLVLRRVNGMSMGGGEEISAMCDLTIASDNASFGQIGPVHGSAAMGGAVQIKPVCMTYEDAFYNSTSCEQWSAAKMFRKNYIHKVIPVFKQGDKFIRNPEIVVDKWIDEMGDIVYGEWKTGEERKKAKELVKTLTKDMSLLDKEIDNVVWQYTNLYPGCLALSYAILRRWKRSNFDFDRVPIMYWWSAMPYSEYDMGMTSFASRKLTGKGEIDMIKYQQMLASGHPIDEELFNAVMPKIIKK